MAVEEQLLLDGLALNNPDVVQATNLVTNPSFEVDDSLWGTLGGTSSISTSWEKVGNQSNQVTGSGAVTGRQTELLPVVAGKTYSFGLYMNLTNLGGGPGNIALDVQWFTAASALISTTSRHQTSAAFETRLKREGEVAPPTAAFARMRCFSDSNSGFTTTFEIDAAMFVEGAVLPAYFDGDTPGYAWSGTEHASTSTSVGLHLQELDLTPPKKLWEWAKSADRDGAQLVRPPKVELREVTAKVQVDRQATMDLALDKLGALTDRLQKAELRADDGNPIAAVYTPAGSTYDYTLYVLGGEIEGLPINLTEGWLVKAPTVTIKLYCDPFGYGAEYTYPASPASSATPFLAFEVPDVPGDVPASARLIVNDGATQNRDHLEWGVECRHYNAATSLLAESDNLVTSGFAGAQTTRTGAYDVGGGNTVVRATLTTSPVAVCSTGDLSHVGPYRVKARVYPSDPDVQVRLAWQDGDAAFTANEYANPPGEDAWFEIDLGLINIRPAELGTQKWLGRIEAYAATVGATVDVDYLILIPVDGGYGKARRTLEFETPIVFSARDEFDQSAGALAGKTAPVGGTWTVVTGSDTDDFSVETGGHTAQRTAVTDSASRMVSLGTTNYTAVVVQTDLKFSSLASTQNLGVFARCDGTGATNAIQVQLRVQGGNFTLVGSIGASAMVTVNLPTLAVDSWYTIRLLVDASGRWVVWLFPTGGEAGDPVSSGVDSALATGGARATGRVGLVDYNGAVAAVTRNYDNFMAFVPTADAVLFSSSQAEIRPTDPVALRKNGSLWGRPRLYRGTRFELQPEGQEAKVSRVLVKANRNDVDELPAANVTDSLTAQAAITPRWINIPRV